MDLRQLISEDSDMVLYIDQAALRQSGNSNHLSAAWQELMFPDATGEQLAYRSVLAEQCDELWFAHWSIDGGSRSEVVGRGPCAHELESIVGDAVVVDEDTFVVGVSESVTGLEKLVVERPLQLDVQHEVVAFRVRPSPDSDAFLASRGITLPQRAVPFRELCLHARTDQGFAVWSEFRMPTADGAERAEVILGVWVDNLNYDPAIRLLSLNDAAKAMYVNRAGNVVTVGVSMTHDEAHEQLLRTSAAYERVMASGGLSQALTGVAARGQDAPLNRGSSRGGGKKTKKDANNCAAARARQEATRNCTRRRGPGEYGACVERHMQAQKDVFNYCG